MRATRDRVPGHLRQFVVEQEYSAYDEIDQAVWRFVLLQTYARLCETAHPAYVQGLERTGIEPGRIPRIAEMDRRLQEFGWGAVAVDGFIPPRAFQEFQALGILTIAVEIRRPEQLAYTPAPDILHESAGHAPILPDPGYRRYLQAFGRVGARAFSGPADRALYQVIHRLSELKERALPAPREVAAAEAELLGAAAAQGPPSEAALLSRLHWWTVEYGLVGTPGDYRLYGAGLLSSLGESHSCRRPEVRKLPFDVGCVDVAYDITRPQPQLFVAESFEQLESVLDEVATGLAQHCGGAIALVRARDSRELATVELDSGIQISGVLSAFAGPADAPDWLDFEGPCALARDGRILSGCGPGEFRDGLRLPLGRLADGSALSALAAGELRREVDLSFRSGVRVTGQRGPVFAGEDGRLLAFAVRDCRMTRGAEPLLGPGQGSVVLPVGERVRAAFAGPSDPGFHADTDFSPRGVPARKVYAGETARLLSLYRSALRLWEKPEAPELVAGFEALEEALCEEFPDNWLLRWNLLECLCKVGRGPELASRLRSQLLQVEGRFPDDAPVSTGLRFLDERYPEPR